MPKVAKSLSALAISKLTHSDLSGTQPDVIAIGHVPGLCLQIGPGNSYKAWIYRVQIGNKRRWIGLGGYPTVTLAMATETARRMRDEVRDGIDPIEARRAARATLLATQARDITLADVIERYRPIRMAKFASDKVRARWTKSLADYLLPLIGSRRIGDIDKSDIVQMLKQPHTNYRTGVSGELFTNVPETGNKLRGYTEEILDWAISNGLREPPNPAKWNGNLEHDLPRKPADISHPMLAVNDAPLWYARISARTGISARALEFLAMTAARSANVREAEWSQFDFNAQLWTINASDMKMSVNGDHVVPLTRQMIALLKQLPQSTKLVFPSVRGKTLSDAAIGALMRKMHAAQFKQDAIGWIDKTSLKPAVPHGLRSTFSTWANDHAEYEPDMIEFALAHRVGNEVAQRYRRGSMIEKRRALMADWCSYLNSVAITRG